MKHLSILLAAALACGNAAGAGTAALSDAEVTRTECSACHQMFPSQLLPAPSWTRILATLDHHFGEDASLPADKSAQIAAYLTAHASARFGAVDPANPPLRITELDWYKSEHGRFTAQALADPKIGTMSNCAGCHSGL